MEAFKGNARVWYRIIYIS